MDVIANILLGHIFIDFENSLYFMKNDPEVKIFYSDKYHYFSLETTTHVAVYFLDFYPTLEVQYSKGWCFTDP